jgi:RimJ/RimL family protein N-acetyltransferase
MDLQPTLRGELLELRPIRPDDFEELFRVGADPLIWEQHPEHDRWTEPVFRRFFDGALECRGGLVALDRATGAMIGSSRYFGYDPARSVVEIGWSFLARAYWGGKYNGEMKRLMLTHAFRYVDRVIFVIGAENRRSRRAVEKIGAVLSTIELDARGEDKVIYELTRARYLK